MELSNIITKWKTKALQSPRIYVANFDMGEYAHNNCRATLSNDEMESIE